MLNSTASRRMSRVRERAGIVHDINASATLAVSLNVRSRRMRCLRLVIGTTHAIYFIPIVRDAVLRIARSRVFP